MDRVERWRASWFGGFGLNFVEGVLLGCLVCKGDDKDSVGENPEETVVGEYCFVTRRGSGRVGSVVIVSGAGILGRENDCI